MGFGNGLSAGLAGGSPEISGPMEGGTGPAVGVDKNPAARHDLQHLACFFHGELLLLLREIKTHGGPLRSTAGRGEPHEVRFLLGSTMALNPGRAGETSDQWTVCSPGLVFDRQESSFSVWLMKLPR